MPYAFLNYNQTLNTASSNLDCPSKNVLPFPFHIMNIEYLNAIIILDHLNGL